MVASSIHLGTSEFSAAGWEGSFYPEGRKPADYLTFGVPVGVPEFYAATSAGFQPPADAFVGTGGDCGNRSPVPRACESRPDAFVYAQQTLNQNPS